MFTFNVSGYDCPGAVLLRAVLRRFGLPALGPHGCEYWGCEVRQVKDRLDESSRLDPIRYATNRYLADLSAPFFNTFFLSKPCDWKCFDTFPYDY